MSFCENLMRLRKQKGLSQEELANKIDVSRQTVSKWELGASTPEMDKLVQLADFFGITVDKLLHSDDITSETTPKAEEVKVEEPEKKAEPEQPKASEYIPPKSNYSDDKSKSGNKILAAIMITLILAVLCVLIVMLVRDIKGNGDNQNQENSAVITQNAVPATDNNTVPANNNTVTNETNTTDEDFNKQFKELQEKQAEMMNKMMNSDYINNIREKGMEQYENMMKNYNFAF